MDFMKKIIKQRPIILWAEIAALLHDIGKLSKAFLEYRQTWRKIPNGWDKDPHEHEFLDKDSLIKQFNDVNEWFCKRVKINEEEISIKDVIHKHIKPEQSAFLNMIKAADGKDAALDRNNPLFTADQAGDVFDTDVFGAESESSKLSDLTIMDKRREELYQALNNKMKLPNSNDDFLWHDRECLFKTIWESFDKAFSDTTRPDNDTSLWEHCYAVASILKVILVHQLIYGEKLDDFTKVRFGILGIGWDGLSFMSCGHKIGDIIGRKICIDKFKKQIKRKIEWEYVLGNTVYEDDNGIFFLIPVLPSQIDLDKTDFHNLCEYGQLLKEIQSEIVRVAIRLTSGDLYPKFYLIQDTRFITHLVKCIRTLKGKINYPISNPSPELIEKFKKDWDMNKREKICPICRRKPMEKKWEICKHCMVLRRRGSFFKFLSRKRNEAQTPFISEIVQANESDNLKKRAALIVAKFGLNYWLDGRMVRTLFITEAKGIEKELEELGNTKSFEKEENEMRKWLSYRPFGNLITKGYDYHRIKSEIDLCHKYNNLSDKDKREYAQNILFLYDRRITYDKGKKESILNRNPEKAYGQWEDFKNATIEEYGLHGEDTEYLLYNILCAKTPTPSTILDVWHTTEKFFNSFKERENDKLLGIGQETRWEAEIPRPEEVIVGAAYEGTIGTIPVEIVWLQDNKDTAWIIGNIEKVPDGDHILLKGKPLGKSGDIKTGPIKNPCKNVQYFPCRIITTTPDIFMAIVPADRAIKVTQEIYKKYIRQFGKVIGRLPLSIGNIFFTEKMPMFVVLDAGKRMLENFEQLHEKKRKFRIGKNHKVSTITETPLKISIDEFTIPGNTSIASSITWEIPYQLGNKGTDFYHPYFIIKKGSKDYSTRKNYFNTVAGEVIHCTEVQPGDILELYPNYYDFEFLDSNTRRHNIKLGNNRRKSNVADFKSKPFLLDELGQKIEYLWEVFLKREQRKEITDTKLRNLQSLWLTKYTEWEIDISNKTNDQYKQWIHLVNSSIRKEFKKIDDKHYTLLQETIENGLFFDTLELYLGILKEKIKSE